MRKPIRFEDESQTASTRGFKLGSAVLYDLCVVAVVNLGELLLISQKRVAVFAGTSTQLRI